MKIKQIWPFDLAKDHKEWINLLNKEGLRSEKTVDFTLVIEDEKTGQIIGTGSLLDNLIKMVAIDSEFQGEGSFNSLMTELLNEIYRRGHTSAYVYARPCAAEKFKFLGFNQLVNWNNQIVFMERSILGIEHQIDYWKKQTEHLQKPAAAIVMNANPFTLGHQYLVERASLNEKSVIVFVVSQERSLFSFKDRIAMVKLGTAHLKNVVVVPTGPYMVSTATFPSYFLNEEMAVSKIQASIDAALFSEIIAPSLNINKRYLGSEPNSEVTNLYNQVLSKELHNIETIIVPRVKNQSGVISATQVRRYLAPHSSDLLNFEKLKELVPQTTLNYLKELLKKKESKR